MNHVINNFFEALSVMLMRGLINAIYFYCLIIIDVLYESTVM